MILRLDPRIPMVWRDPFSLQFGVEPAVVVLRDVSPAQERLISTLAKGISASGYEMVAELFGATVREARALLAQLDPVLAGQAGSVTGGAAGSGAGTGTALGTGIGPGMGGGAGTPFFVEIVGQGPTAERIARALAQSGCQVSVSSAVSPEGSTPQLGIAVGHYVFDPSIYSHWLRRDIPHLPVVFADGAVTVGPVVDPGRTACLHCIEFYRRDADPRWSTLASQLWGRRSAAETPLVSREAAARVSRMALRRLNAGPNALTKVAATEASSVAGSMAASVRIDAESGAVTHIEWLPHPDCGCCSIDSVSGVLRGIDSALSKRRTAFPPPPRRGRVADAPA